MKNKKFIIVLIIAIMAWLVFTMAGCGSSTSQQTTAEQKAQMAGATRTLTDMAGRTVTVPGTIDKAFSTSPVAAIALYCLSPDKMVGWNYELKDTDKKYIADQYETLPNLGGWYAKNTGSNEEILKIHPDVIISMGVITKQDLSNADKIQEQLGIPVVMVNSPVTEMDKALEFLGDLLGEEEQAQKLADYCRSTIADVKARAATIPEDKKVRVYYAEGAKGLQSESDSSMHIETLNFVGGINVAKDIEKGGNAGQTPVSLEQVLGWNPEIIVAWSEGQGGYSKGLQSDPGWQTIKAVQDHKVYSIPTSPFNWFDRPPSVNRIIGFKWLGNLLYPDVYDYDMVKEVQDFYSLFYHYNLSDDEAKAFLAQDTSK